MLGHLVRCVGEDWEGRWGWGNGYRHGVSKEVFCDIDYAIWRMDTRSESRAVFRVNSDALTSGKSGGKRK